MTERKLLIKERNQRKVNQEEVAKFAGIEIGYYSMIENGKRTPSYTVMKKISEFFGRTPDYFFYNDI